MLGVDVGDCVEFVCICVGMFVEVGVYVFLFF